MLQTEAFMETILKLVEKDVVDIGLVSRQWGKTTWLWVCDVGSYQIAEAPSCAGLVHCVIMGQVNVFLVDMRSLDIKADKAKGKSSSMAELKEFLTTDSVSAADLKELFPTLYRTVAFSCRNTLALVFAHWYGFSVCGHLHMQT